MGAITNNGPVGATMNIIPTRTGMMTVAIGGPQQMPQQAAPAFTQILSTVRLGQ